MTRRLFPHPNVSDELPILLRAYVESATKGEREGAMPRATGTEHLRMVTGL